MSTLPATPQVMMTLAALAPTDANQNPYGKSIAQQEQQILDDINERLADTGLATNGEWTAIWVGLTEKPSNMAYIAQSTSGVYALCFRGTVSSDLSEDMDVGTLVPFTVGNVSQGAMDAFNEVVKNTTLVETLNGLQAQNPLCVTGHSLGGALVTMVSLYLTTGVTGFSQENIYPFTFAAPTAGDGSFASGFDAQFPWAQCIYNQYDVVPQAWSNLVGAPPLAAEYFYPNNSPALGPQVQTYIQNIAADTNGNIYVQPAQQPALNTGFTARNPHLSTLNTLDEWKLEAAYQHGNNTYLSLLGAPALPPFVPAAAEVSSR